MTGESHTGTEQHAFQAGAICHYFYFVKMFSIVVLLASTVLLHTSRQAIPTYDYEIFTYFST